ncbi:MAG: hypothetical protein QW205_01685 [Desulfurococcaceae archaeon]
MNYVFLVEDFVYRVDFENYQPSEEEIKRVGEILGQPTKKLNVVMERYWQVFRNYIEKKCASLGSTSVCLYSWRVNVPFRLFPLALHAHGTIILFENEKPMQVLAFPMNKALSYNKSPGLPPEEYSEKIPREVSARIDGWQLTAYYNPLINRWIFATRYALHNMYYMKGRLVVEPMESIANPYVEIGDRIAEKDGLYERLDKYRGWTFTFVLEGPEPAVTRPPYPIGADVEKYKLYVLMARSPDGKLYTWSETRKLVDYNAPPLFEPKSLKELYEDARRSLIVRSYFAYLETGDPENPIIAELESDYYPEAMNAKYLNDAKSAAVLVCEDLGEELAKIMGDWRANLVVELSRLKRTLEDTFARLIESRGVHAVSSAAVNTLREMGVKTVKPEELAKALSEGNIKRVVKKLMALLLEGKSLTTREPLEVLKEYIGKIAKTLEPS